MPNQLREAGAAFRDSAAADPIRPLVICLALITIGCGLQLLAPYNTFDAAPVYRFMRHLPEPLWGALMLFIGGTKLYANLLHGRVMRCRPCRWLPTLLNAAASFVWAVAFAGALVSDATGWGVIIYGGLSLGSAWCAIRRWAEVTAWN